MVLLIAVPSYSQQSSVGGGISGPSNNTGNGGITVYSGATALSGTQYFPIGGGSLPSGTEADVSSQAPAVGTVANLTADLSAAPGGGNSVVFTWRDAGSSKSVTCTIANAATTCSDLTHSFTPAQLDKLDILAVTTGAIAGTPILKLSATFGAVSSIPLNNRIRSFGGSFDGGGSSLTSGKTTYLTIPFACTISAWNILVDTGTATIKTWKIATGTTIPTVANSINTSGVAISSGTAVHSTTLTDFTTLAVSNNDIIGINLFAVAGGATFVSYVTECDQ